MNLLELVKELAAESGTVSPSDISTVVDPGDGSFDEHVNDLVRWVIRANHEIELQRDDWRFRTVRREYELTGGIHAYPLRQAIADFHKILWFRQPWNYQYLTINDGYSPVRFIPYRRWAGDYSVRLARTSQGRPHVVTLDPQERLLFYPEPDQAYTIEFDYVREAQRMTRSDTTEPKMPSRYHDVIVYYALIHYAFSDEAAAKAQTARAQYDRLFMALANDQAPEMQIRLAAPRRSI